MHYHLFVSPSEILCMLVFKNQFKNKKDEGGCNLLYFMQIRYGPQAPAKLLIWSSFGPMNVNPNLLFHGNRNVFAGNKLTTEVIFSLITMDQVILGQFLSVDETL